MGKLTKSFCSCPLWETRRKETSAVGSLHQKTGEYTAGFEDLNACYIDRRFCELAIVLQLLVVTCCVSRVEAGKNTSMESLRVVRDDRKGTQ
jgi:hypothetical protein